MNKYNNYFRDEEITKAVTGDEAALSFVVKGLDTYAAWCATPNNIKGHFYKNSEVDEDIKQQILTKLIQAIKYFKNK